ncbi:hypothetical protein XIS1_450014 [Xenorhabdus innexi]|uniref:Uncharacterized protein n=1 Tax=Xenorhabdus innexi TaxID=290109 RepID=A0A1N6MXU8_9GAMM|nr:hypothetical protein XIS1_450014 [Xenorhabdus innexi]
MNVVYFEYKPINYDSQPVFATYFKNFFFSLLRIFIKKI